MSQALAAAAGTVAVGMAVVVGMAAAEFPDVAHCQAGDRSQMEVEEGHPVDKTHIRILLNSARSTNAGVVLT